MSRFEENIDLGYVPSYARLNDTPRDVPRDRMALVRVIHPSVGNIPAAIELNFGRAFSIGFEPHEARALARLLDLAAELLCGPCFKALGGGEEKLCGRLLPEREACERCGESLAQADLHCAPYLRHAPPAAAPEPRRSL